MIVELLRMVADALRDPNTGVNAQLAGVPRDAADVAPPAVAEVLDASAEDRRMEDGDKSAAGWPKLLVLEDQPSPFDGEVGTRHRDGQVRVTVVYLPRDPGAAGVAAASSYTRRAAARAVRGLLRNDSAPARTRNSVYLVAAVPQTGLTWRPPSDKIGELRHAGALTWTFDVRDQAP